MALLDAHAEIDAVVGMRRLHVPNSVAYRTDEAGFARPVEQVGELAPNGAVYLIRTTALRVHQSLYPPRTVPLAMDDISSIDIDTEADWRLAEAALGLNESGESEAGVLRRARS